MQLQRRQNPQVTKLRLCPREEQTRPLVSRCQQEGQTRGRSPCLAVVPTGILVPGHHVTCPETSMMVKSPGTGWLGCEPRGHLTAMYRVSCSKEQRCQQHLARRAVLRVK